jgi:hypothetical protein
MSTSKRVNVQVHVHGRGLDRLSADGRRELVERTLNGEEPPDDVTVDLKVWRSGKELDWTSSSGLRAMIRRVLPGLTLTVRRD